MNLQAVRESSELLARLTNTQLELFESLSSERHLADGEILFEEGGEADSFYIIVTGRIGLELTSPGHPPMVIQTLGPGDLVGVSWFFSPYRWNWRARSQGETDLIAFDAVEVRRQCGLNRDLDLEVLGAVATEAVRRLHGTRIQLLDLYRST